MLPQPVVPRPLGSSAFGLLNPKFAPQFLPRPIRADLHCAALKCLNRYISAQTCSIIKVHQSVRQN